MSGIDENLEAIENYGYNFKNRDVGDLRRMLEKLILYPEKVREKKETARRDILNNYSWGRVMDQMEALYHSLLVK